MTLSDYFEGAQGTGILATSESDGTVNIAVYSKPYFLTDSDMEVAFIMLDRLSHENLQSNPHAAYLFMEPGEDYVGKRLTLTHIREETDPDRIESVRRRPLSPEAKSKEREKEYLVHFRVDYVRPLTGTGREL